MNKYFYFLLSLLFSFKIVTAHNYGFIENKGQWEQVIQYKATTL